VTSGTAGDPCGRVPEVQFLNFRLNVYTIEYFVNNVKLFDLETFPCAEDIDAGYGRQINRRQSDFWHTALSSTLYFNKYRTGKQNVGIMGKSDGPEGLVLTAEFLFDDLKAT
jgi:hypothetical protein